MALPSTEFCIPVMVDLGLPRLTGKESVCNAGDAGGVGLIPGSGRTAGEENGNPLQYSCLDLAGWSMGLQNVGHK